MTPAEEPDGTARNRRSGTVLLWRVNESEWGAIYYTYIYIYNIIYGTSRSKK